ncbi:MAG: hypothetical protein ABFS32_09795 [Bacteroidota bacterium]
MKKLFFNSMMILVGFSLFFGSCNKDNIELSDGPEDKLIPIDENQAFNMKNFVNSYEQLFNTHWRYAGKYSHDFKNGKALSSWQGFGVYGNFGNKLYETTHNYNNDGVIISSDRVKTSIVPFLGYSDYPAIVLRYKYDSNGFISTVYKIYEADTLDVVDFEYNQEGNVILKTHHSGWIKSSGQEYYNEVSEAYSYNSAGQMIRWESNDGGQTFAYIMEYNGDGNMIRYAGESSGINETLSEYDTDGRVISMTRPAESQEVRFSYDNDFELILYVWGEMKTRVVLDVHLFPSTIYTYDFTGEVLNNCIAIEVDEDGFIKGKSFYEGTIENLELTGYTVVDLIDDTCEQIAKEDYYEASGSQLYYATVTLNINDCSIAGRSWFTPSGTAVAVESIPQDWVFKLSYYTMVGLRYF